jgi:hypothetical protein
MASTETTAIQSSICIQHLRNWNEKGPFLKPLFKNVLPNGLATHPTRWIIVPA